MWWAKPVKNQIFLKAFAFELLPQHNHPNEVLCTILVTGIISAVNSRLFAGLSRGCLDPLLSCIYLTLWSLPTNILYLHALVKAFVAKVEKGLSVSLTFHCLGSPSTQPQLSVPFSIHSFMRAVMEMSGANMYMNTKSWLPRNQTILHTHVHRCYHGCEQ